MSASSNPGGRTTFTLHADGKAATLDSGMYVYTVQLGTTYEARQRATKNTPRTVVGFDAKSLTLEGSSGRRTSATWPSFLGTYLVPRARKATIAPARMPPPPPADERLGEVLALLQRIAAELGIK